MLLGLLLVSRGLSLLRAAAIGRLWCFGRAFFSLFCAATSSRSLSGLSGLFSRLTARLCRIDLAGIADKLDNRQLGIVTIATAESQDPRITARTVLEPLA